MELTLSFMILSNTLSFLGSLIIILLYCYQKQIMKQKQLYAQTLIMRMSLSDLVYSISMFLYIRSNIIQQQKKIIDQNETINIIRCQSQAIIMHYSAQSGFINCFNLTFCTYLTLVKNVKNIEQYDLYFLADAYIIPTILSLYGYLFECYGVITPYLCFFKATFKCPLILFYIPYVLIVLANFYLLKMSYSFIKSITPQKIQTLEFQPIEIEDVELQISKKIIANMVFYPLILTLCWIVPLAWRICTWIGINGEVSFLQYPNFIIADLQGFLNCLFFLLNTLRSKLQLQTLLEEKDKINSSLYQERAKLQSSSSHKTSVSDSYSEFTK